MRSKSSLTCPFCGHDSLEVDTADVGASDSNEQVADNATNSSPPTSDALTTMNEEVQLEEEEMKKATQAVVKEALKVLNPLLEKLNEANEQLKQQQTTRPPAIDMSQDGLAKNLEQLQKVSEEKLKNQELKVAARMKKMQSRLA